MPESDISNSYSSYYSYITISCWPKVWNTAKLIQNGEIARGPAGVEGNKDSYSSCNIGRPWIIMRASISSKVFEQFPSFPSIFRFLFPLPLFFSSLLFALFHHSPQFHTFPPFCREAPPLNPARESLKRWTKLVAKQLWWILSQNKYFL